MSQCCCCRNQCCFCHACALYEVRSVHGQEILKVTKGVNLSRYCHKALNRTHGCVPETCKLKWPGRPRTSPGKHRRPPDPGSLPRDRPAQKLLGYPLRRLSRSDAVLEPKPSADLLDDRPRIDPLRRRQKTPQFYSIGLVGSCLVAPRTSLAGQVFC